MCGKGIFLIEWFRGMLGSMIVWRSSVTLSIIEAPWETFGWLPLLFRFSLSDDSYGANGELLSALVLSYLALVSILST